MSDIDSTKTNPEGRDPRQGGTESGGTSDKRPELEISHWLVGVVDVLGQKAKLRAMRDLPDDATSHERFVSAIRETFGVVKTIRNAFQSYQSEVQKTTEVYDGIPELLKPLAREFKKSDVRIRGVSDSVILDTPLKSNDDFVTPTNGVFQVLFGLCGMSIASLAIGHPVRGAVEVGLGGEIERGELYGPALERAWFLESNVAEYPRILVGPELMTFLRDIAGRKGPGHRLQFAAGIARSSLSLVTIDTDGMAVLDYLGPGFREVLRDDTEMRGLVLDAAKFVRASHERFLAADDFKLGPRYGRLRRYFDARMPLWGLG